MEFQHELVIPDEGLPFKFFLFEGSQGNYVREKHWLCGKCSGDGCDTLETGA